MKGQACKAQRQGPRAGFRGMAQGQGPRAGPKARTQGHDPDAFSKASKLSRGKAQRHAVDAGRNHQGSLGGTYSRHRGKRQGRGRDSRQEWGHEGVLRGQAYWRYTRNGILI